VASDVVPRLIFAAKSGGLPHLMSALRTALGTEVGLFDRDGSALVTVPARTVWDIRALREAADGTDASARGIMARPVDLAGQPVAVLAARLTNDPDQLLVAAADLVALELARLRAAQDGRRELALNLIDDLLTQRIPESEAMSRLRTVGIDPAIHHRVMVGRTDAPAHTSRRLWSGVQALLGEHPDPFLRIQRGDDIVMIVPDDAMVQRLAQELHRQLLENSKTARVGVSNSHVGGSGLRAAFFEASSAVRSGVGVHYPGRFDLAQVVIMATSAPLIDSARQQIAPLIEYDLLHGSALVDTLRAYLTQDRDVGATCSALFIHRNTLRYRLQQIAGLLDANLESTKEIATLWLAFLVLDDERSPEGS
jgi:sugar diacid utilization regulator